MKRQIKFPFVVVSQIIAVITVAVCLWLASSEGEPIKTAIGLGILWTLIPTFFWVLVINPNFNIRSRNSRNKNGEDSSLEPYNLAVRIAFFLFAAFLFFSRSVPIYQDLFDVLAHRALKSVEYVVKEDDEIGFGFFIRAIDLESSQVVRGTYYYYFSPRKRIVIGGKYYFIILPRSKTILTVSSIPSSE